MAMSTKMCHWKPPGAIAEASYDFGSWRLGWVGLQKCAIENL